MERAMIVPRSDCDREHEAGSPSRIDCLDEVHQSQLRPVAGPATYLAPCREVAPRRSGRGANIQTTIRSIDFVHDRLSNGRPCEMLTVSGQCGREALCVRVAAGDGSATNAMRDLVDHILVSPQIDTGKGANLEIKGKLRSLPGGSANQQQVVGAMVAEEGLEPPTRGL